MKPNPQPPQMSSLEQLWVTLRRAGAEETAPLLIANGAHSVSQLVLTRDQLQTAGLKSWQFEAILAASNDLGAPAVVAPTTRGDLPGTVAGKRANLQAALDAALPNQRLRSLKALDDDILAKSTNPANDARVRTYLAICRSWEAVAFPLNPENVHCFAASLKAGQYRSAAVYFQSIVGHQQRTLRTPVEPLVRQCIRDYTRSILRGLGVSKLKDSFNGMLIGNIPFTDEISAFTFSELSHCRDASLIGLWFMLREIEMANAHAVDFTLHGSEVHLTVPLQKTDQRGTYTQRTLTCTCAAKVHNMCVWHAAERHVLRVEAHPRRGDCQHFPLFPTWDGLPAPKKTFIEAIRTVIEATGTSLTRTGPDGSESQRFHGAERKCSHVQEWNCH